MKQRPVRIGMFHNNDYLFRLVYNKGGDGTGSSYILNSNNKLEEHLSYAFKRITTYGTWGDNVITASTGDTDRTDARRICGARYFGQLSEFTGRYYKYQDLPV